jgi:hypothetical protein
MPKLIFTNSPVMSARKAAFGKCFKCTRKFIFPSFFLPMLFVAPASTNFSLQEWGFGSGSTPNSSSNNYQIQGEFNQGEGNQLESANYAVGPGSEYALMADVAPAPNLTNDARWYNQLKLVLDPGPNSTDATFAIAISPDNFTTTYYVQSDHTLGTTLGSEDWQTYAAWGGVTGIQIIALTPGTTYSVKVKSEQGNFTESPWGPVDTADTYLPQLSFDIDTASSDTETAPPYAIPFSNLTSSVVNTASAYVWIDLDTNAEAGVSVYVQGKNAGLSSSSTGHTINSVSANLTATSEGYGAQVIATNQVADGPLVAESPFNGASDVVGAIPLGFTPLVSSILSPLDTGRAQIALKAKIDSATPASTDYTETITLVAAASF